MRIECPNCGVKGEIDESKKPAGANSIRCPRCKESIPFASGGESVTATAAGNTAADIAGLSPTSGNSLSSGADPEPVVKARCVMCGNEFPREDMVRFGPSLVCAGCKPMYVQMLEQGNANIGMLRYAGFWPRFGAKFIDGLVLFAINMSISFMIGIAVATVHSNSAAVIALKAVEFMIETAIGITMVTYFLGKYGATPGKMALGLKVVTPDGGQVSYLQAFGRYFAELLSSITLGIGYLMVIFNDEKKALHDMICNTRVVYK